MNSKDTNPKDAVGIRKVAMSAIPAQPLMEMGLAMMEGARKYGRHNYRIAGVRSSVYYDAALRHLMAWWEGEDVDPDSGLPHLVKAMACLCVIRDSTIRGNVVDDRPPSMDIGWQNELNKKASDLIDRLPNSKDAYVKESISSSLGLEPFDSIADPRVKEYRPGEIVWVPEPPTIPYQLSLSVGNPAPRPSALGCIDPKQNAWNPLLERVAPGGSDEGPLEE